jgi:hypothetical protein
MDFFSFLSVLWKRRIIVAVGLVLTVVAALFGATKLGSYDYKSSGSVVLLAPKTDPAAETTGSNPYLAYAGALNFMATVLSETFKDPGLEERLASEGATAAYEVKAGDGGLLTVDVEGTEETPTQATLERIMDAISEQLRDIQLAAGASKTTLITDTLLRKSEKPSIGQGSRVRAFASIGILGVVATVGVAFLVEARSGSRERRPRRRRRDDDLSVLQRESSPNGTTDRAATISWSKGAGAGEREASSGSG